MPLLFRGAFPSPPLAPFVEGWPAGTPTAVAADPPCAAARMARMRAKVSAALSAAAALVALSCCILSLLVLGRGEGAAVVVGEAVVAEAGGFGVGAGGAVVPWESLLEEPVAVAPDVVVLL